MAHIFNFQNDTIYSAKECEEAHSASSVVNANPIRHISHAVSTTAFQNPLSSSSCYMCELWGKERLSHLLQRTQLRRERSRLQTSASESSHYTRHCFKRSHTSNSAPLLRENSWANKMAKIQKVNLKYLVPNLQRKANLQQLVALTQEFKLPPLGREGLSTRVRADFWNLHVLCCLWTLAVHTGVSEFKLCH